MTPVEREPLGYGALPDEPWYEHVLTEIAPNTPDPIDHQRRQVALAEKQRIQQENTRQLSENDPGGNNE